MGRTMTSIKWKLQDQQLVARDYHSWLNFITWKVRKGREDVVEKIRKMIYHFYTLK